jgi:hypothetical protein
VTRAPGAGGGGYNFNAGAQGTGVTGANTGAGGRGANGADGGGGSGVAGDSGLVIVRYPDTFATARAIGGTYSNPTGYHCYTFNITGTIEWV